MTSRISPFGSWESPISASFITSQSIKLSSLDVSEDKASNLYWVEGRPQEKGRQCVVKLNCQSGKMSDVTPATMNARSRVHEYGGGQTVPVGNSGDTITSDFSTNALIYTQCDGDVSTQGVTLSGQGPYRYADMSLDPLQSRGGSRLLVAVREDHTVDEPAHVVNSIVILSVDDTSREEHVEAVLVNSEGDPNTMYSSPRMDPSGTFLSWVQWKHPDMPWDATELCVGRLTADGRGLTDVTVIAGGDEESVSQPRWSPILGDSHAQMPQGATATATLLYLSDKASGWWNLHKAELKLEQEPNSGDALPVVTAPVLLCEGYEFGPPAWSFGVRSYDIVSSTGQVVCTWHHSVPSTCGNSNSTESVLCSVVCSAQEENVLRCNLSCGENSSSTMSVRPLPAVHPAASPKSYFLSSVTSLVAAGQAEGLQDIFLIGGSPVSPVGVYKLQLSLPPLCADSSPRAPAPSSLKLLKSSMTVQPPAGFISHPQHIQFPTRLFGAAAEKADSMGEAGVAPVAHGLFYPPQNELFRSKEGTLPPLLVKIHGGPTGQTSTICRLDIQFFTSRGVAVLDVDYGGSTGYGRDYRNRLKGTWGLTDVEDCCRGAEYLVSQGLVDGDRLCIDGGSAGGFTALGSIAFRDTFRAATSSYGIGDLEALACDTHKFESRYLDNLVGPYPESKQVFEDRSALRHVNAITCPILLLHGADDKVVLPNQATMMYEAVTAKKIPAAIVVFEGEGHGWRQAETIQRALNLELNFYGLIFDFSPDVIVEVPVVNMTR